MVDLSRIGSVVYHLCTVAPLGLLEDSFVGMFFYSSPSKYATKSILELHQISSSGFCPISIYIFANSYEAIQTLGPGPTLINATRFSIETKLAVRKYSLCKYELAFPVGFYKACRLGHLANSFLPSCLQSKSSCEVKSMQRTYIWVPSMLSISVAASSCYSILQIGFDKHFWLNIPHLASISI